jgi:SAM-dependent methyltransferase
MAMSSLSDQNPLGRFSGLADIYARCRPTYPNAAIEAIMRRGAIGPQSLLVDVGCGTGISARLFAEHDVPVIGIEPNAEMRLRAERETVSAGMPAPTYREGSAEATGLPDNVADAVLAAQAFHWFHPENALREFHRILKPGSWAALMWNERDEADPFTAAYGCVIRSTPEAAAVELPRARAGEPLLVSPLFKNAERLVFANEQVLDEDGLLGRTFSASYAPKEPAAVETFAASLRKVFTRYQSEGRVVIRYETSLYLGQRRDDRP